MRVVDRAVRRGRLDHHAGTPPRSGGSRSWPTARARTPSVELATFQPLLTPPTTLSFGQRASVKNTSQNSAVPSGWVMPRTSTPGWLHRHEQVGDALVLGRVRVGAGEQEAVVGVVALGGPHLLAVDDPLVAVEHGRRLQAGQVGARVGLAEALAPAHRRRCRISGRNSFFCSSVPHCRIVGPTSVSPKKSARIGALARANSSASTTPCIVVRPLPPYSFGQVAQIQPPS